MNRFSSRQSRRNRAITKLDPLEGILLIILGGFAALFLILSGDYNPTAALFPRWVALASVIFLLLAVGAQLFGKPKPRTQESDEEFPQPGLGAVYWPVVLGLQAAYVLGIYLLGFSIATLLYLVIAPIHLHYRRWIVIGIQSVLLTMIIAGSFIWFFHIRLPKGILWSLW